MSPKNITDLRGKSATRSRGRRVGFLIWHGPDFGGVQRRYARLACYLARTRADLDVFVIVHDESRERLFNFIDHDSPVTVKAFGVGSYQGSLAHVLGNLLRLRKILVKTRLDQIHLCDSPSYLSVLLSLAAPLESQLTVAFVDSVYRDRVRTAERFFSRLSLLRFAKVDCLSLGIAKNFAECYPTHSVKKEIAPCSFTDYSRLKIVEDRDIDVLMLARFADEKGYQLVEECQSKIPGWKVHLCGFGPRTPRISSPFVQTYHAENAFAILGRSKIFLSIQRVNNYPSQALLEAMASGCAIVATDVGETRELLDETCSILIPYESKALLDAISKLMVDPSLRTRLGAEARKRVLRDHTVERYEKYFSKKILMH